MHTYKFTWLYWKRALNCPRMCTAHNTKLWRHYRFLSFFDFHSCRLAMHTLIASSCQIGGVISNELHLWLNLISFTRHAHASCCAKFHYKSGWKGPVFSFTFPVLQWLLLSLQSPQPVPLVCSTLDSIELPYRATALLHRSTTFHATNGEPGSSQNQTFARKSRQSSVHRRR